MRCFIAVELEDYIINNLCALKKQMQSELWGRDKTLKWVRPENMHITLKFLGDVEDSIIADVCRGCDQAAGEHEPFDIEVGAVGTFPPDGAARVVWAGVSRGFDPLKKLYNSVENYMDVLNIPKEGRKFNPHATLARIKLAETGRAVTDLVNKLHVLPFGCQGVTALTIFSSVLDQDGPEYEVIHRAQLTAK